MKTISDIKFNSNLYSQVDHCIVLLYDINVLSVTIPLPNVHLLTFIHYFDKIDNFQHHIDTNNMKTFTLFVYSENIQTWLIDKGTLPDRLEEIIIFCPLTEDKNYWKKWMRRYTQSVKKIISSNQLELELLMSGLNYIKDLFVNFQNDNGILRLLKDDYEKLRLGLINCLEEATNKNEEHSQSNVTKTF